VVTLSYVDLLLSKSRVIACSPLLVCFSEGLDVAGSDVALPKIVLVPSGLELDGHALRVSTIAQPRHQDSSRSTHVPHVVVRSEVQVQVSPALDQVTHDRADTIPLN